MQQELNGECVGRDQLDGASETPAPGAVPPWVTDLVERFGDLERKVSTRLSDQPRQEWFSVKQAAALTGLSQDHIRRAVVGGTLPVSNVGTPDRPLYRISRRDIDEWMERRKAGAYPPPGRKKARAAAPTKHVSRHHGSQPAAVRPAV